MEECLGPVVGIYEPLATEVDSADRLVSFLVATNFDKLTLKQIGTIMLVWVHYEKNGGPEKEYLGEFDTFSAALINLNENAALKRFGRRFKTTPNNKFVEIGPFLKNEDGEECLLMDE